MSKLLSRVGVAIIGVAIMLAFSAVGLPSKANGQARANEAARLVGSWRVLSYEFEFQDGGERVQPLGSRPNGFVILGADGRMMAYLEASDRSLRAPIRNEQMRTGR